MWNVNLILVFVQVPVANKTHNAWDGGRLTDEDGFLLVKGANNNLIFYQMKLESVPLSHIYGRGKRASDWQWKYESCARWLRAGSSALVK